MTAPPDFYLYQGEGNQAALAVLRACRRVGAIAHGGQTVILGRIDPPIAAGVLPHGVSATVIGRSPHGAQALDRLGPGENGSALVWEVYDFGEGKLGLGAAPGIGRGTIYKVRPAIDSKGAVMPAPAAAKAMMGSILRALEAGEGPPKK